ncbi:MAG: hypothetical protein ISS52_04055 [Dehalococcoidia bacterium]|nr:hypothetical protein [Dehalococcoidia bacterium]
MKRALFTILVVLMMAAGCRPAHVTDSGKVDAPPVISSFGGQLASSTEYYVLRWDVSGAEEVSIDKGIGEVASSGSKQISPSGPIQYTLTATNKAGRTSAVVYVAGIAKPDLVITDISQRETTDGYSIRYSIMNRAGANAGPSTTELYVNGECKDKDSVDAIAAGASVTKQFTDWVQSSPTAQAIEVVADAGNTVDESNEGNNKKQVTTSSVVVYDFVNRATTAIWKSGSPPTILFFGGVATCDMGCVRYRNDKKLEDGTGAQRVLETRPKWTDNGWIQGNYYEMHSGARSTWYIVQPGERFFARVGFPEGAYGGDVTFRVMICPEGGSDTWITEVNKSYGSPIKTIDVPLQPWIGKRAGFVLEVQANQSSAQDWACWVEAKIIRR